VLPFLSIPLSLVVLALRHRPHIRHDAKFRADFILSMPGGLVAGQLRDDVSAFKIPEQHGPLGFVVLAEDKTLALSVRP
jgi:hypothetical protein